MIKPITFATCQDVASYVAQFITASSNRTRSREVGGPERAGW
jgi:hypothetical protein